MNNSTAAAKRQAGARAFRLLPCLLLLAAMPARADFVGQRELVLTNIQGTLLSCFGGDPPCPVGEALTSRFLFAYNYTFSDNDFDATISYGPFEYLNTNTVREINFRGLFLTYEYGDTILGENVWDLTLAPPLLFSSDIGLPPTAFTGTFYTLIGGGGEMGTFNVTGSVEIDGGTWIPEPSTWSLAAIALGMGLIGKRRERICENEPRAQNGMVL